MIAVSDHNQITIDQLMITALRMPVLNVTDFCCRGQRLDESLSYQQFTANIDEEEAWISEKQHLLSGDDFGDSMAAVQVSLKSMQIMHIQKQVIA